MIWSAVVLLAALVFLLSYFAMAAACGRADVWSGDLEKALERSSYREAKAQILAGRDWLAAQCPKEVSVEAFDGVRLAGEWVPAENARGTILMCHGWHGSPVTDFGCSFEMYHCLGLNLLLIHQRGQGKSDGRYITFGVKERRDVLRWTQWHNETVGVEVPLLLTGVSMGATTVLMACGQMLPENVRGVIADCGFTSPEEIITSVVRARHLPRWPLVPLMDLQARLWAGFHFREYSTVTALKATELPVLLAHGEDDRFVPCEMSRKNFAACASKDKHLLLVPGAPHGLSFIRQPEEYKRLLFAFLDRTLGK